MDGDRYIDALAFHNPMIIVYGKYIDGPIRIC
jgi:hypothetical protein